MVVREENVIEGWQIFPNRVLLKTPVVTIKSGPVLCERSARQKDFYLFDFPDWVNVVALTPERDMLMIKQFRYGSGRMEIEIPGGMINAGEDPVAAGCRELLEETGFAGGHAKIIGKVCPNPALQRNYCYTVVVEDAVQVAEPNMDEMEDIEFFVHSEKQVMELITTGALDHGLVLNALMFYLFWSRQGLPRCSP